MGGTICNGVEKFIDTLGTTFKWRNTVADVSGPSFVATAETAFGGGRRITCVLCLLFNLRPKLPSRCVVLDLGLFISLAAVL